MKPVEIKYKRSKLKKKRAFSDWDSTALFIALNYALKVRTDLEKLCEDQNKDIDSLDLLITLKPDIIYSIVTGFEAAYNKLLKEDLINAGSPKNSFTFH